MESADWAAWIAVKMVVAGNAAHALGRVRQAAGVHPERYRLRWLQGSRRKRAGWDQQVRQAVFLATPNALSQRADRGLPASHQHASTRSATTSRRRRGKLRQIVSREW